MKLANLEKAYELAPEFKGKMKASALSLKIRRKLNKFCFWTGKKVSFGCQKVFFL